MTEAISQSWYLTVSKTLENMQTIIQYLWAKPIEKVMTDYATTLEAAPWILKFHGVFFFWYLTVF